MATWTPLGAKQPIAFFNPTNQAGTQWSPQLNPKVQTEIPGNVRKYTKTTNGTSVIIGDREYPPTEIQLQWDQIDISDYQKLSSFTVIDPIVFVDNNNNGFLGVLVITKGGQIAGKTSNVWAVQASFLVIAPYNGLTTTMLSITPPTPVAGTQSTTGGYISASKTLYFWMTAFSPWGESLVGTGMSFTTGSGTNTNYCPVTWTMPTSSFLIKVRLYWSSANASAGATLLSEVLSGQTASFTVYSNYFAYNTINPPTYGTAFTGTWQGGIWNQSS